MKFEFDVMSQIGMRDQLPAVTEQNLLALPGLEPRLPGRSGQLVVKVVSRVLGSVWDALIKEWSLRGPRVTTPTVTTEMEQAEQHVFKCLQTFGRADRTTKGGRVLVIFKVQTMEHDGAVVDVRISASDFDDRVINACVMVGLMNTKFPRPAGDGSWYLVVIPWSVYPADQWDVRLQRMERFGEIKKDTASE